MRSPALVKYEFHKYFTRFHIILLAAMFILNIGLIVFQYREYFTAEYRQIQSAKDKLIELYQKEPDTYEQILSEHKMRADEYNAAFYNNMSGGSEKSMPVFENQYVDFENYGDIKLFADVEKVINAPELYKQKMASLIRDSVLRLKESDEDEYIYQYYAQLCSYYMPLAEKELPVSEIRGWNEFFSLQISTIFSVIVLIGTLCDVFTNDAKAGMKNILHVSKYGGRTSAGSKLAFIGISSGIITMVFTLSPLAVFLISCGLSPANQPIQMLNEFQYCHYDITIGQYLLIYLLLKIIVFTYLLMMYYLIVHIIYLIISIIFNMTVIQLIISYLAV